MNHRTWKMEICYSTPLTELRNEHNALYADWKQASLEAERLAKVNGDLCDKIAELERPIRVPFSDEVIEKMAREASYSIGGWGYDNWDKGIMRDAWRASVRRALAAGGLEPCAVPDYAPEDVAFTAERASDEELGQFIHDKWYDCEDDPSEWCKERDNRKREWAAVAAAVRARVEAPLLAEIARLEASCAWNKQAADSLRAQLAAVTAERDAAQAECKHLNAVIADMQPVDATPTDAQVEALARVLQRAYMKECYVDANECTPNTGYLAESRAAYAHIGRVPELDVHPDQLELYKWVTMPDGGYAYAAQQAIDLCRSRIKPVYECKECAKKEEQYQDLISAGNDEADRINKAMEAIDAARAALEGE